MTTALHLSEWEKILNNRQLVSEKLLAVLLCVYHSPNHQNRAGLIAKQLGYTSKNAHSVINGLVGRGGKKIYQYYGEQLLFNRRANGTFQWWTLFFDGWWQQETQYFIWQLKPELREALATRARIQND